MLAVFPLTLHQLANESISHNVKLFFDSLMLMFKGTLFFFHTVMSKSKINKDTRLNDFHSFFPLVFDSSVKKISTLHSNFSCEMCHVSPPSKTETHSIQFAPFTWSVMTLYLKCVALCRFIFVF